MVLSDPEDTPPLARDRRMRLPLRRTASPEQIRSACIPGCRSAGRDRYTGIPPLALLHSWTGTAGWLHCRGTGAPWKFHGIPKSDYPGRHTDKFVPGDLLLPGSAGPPHCRNNGYADSLPASGSGCRKRHIHTAGYRCHLSRLPSDDTDHHTDTGTSHCLCIPALLFLQEYRRRSAERLCVPGGLLSGSLTDRIRIHIFPECFRPSDVRGSPDIPWSCNDNWCRYDPDRSFLSDGLPDHRHTSPPALRPTGG